MECEELNSACAVCAAKPTAPRLLSCLHFVCLQCAAAAAADDDVACPLCGAATPLAAVRADASGEPLLNALLGVRTLCGRVAPSPPPSRVQRSA